MSDAKELSHISDDGKVKMVDVSNKHASLRTAVAEARVMLPPNVLDRLSNHELVLAKGPVFQTAIIAGIMAAKKTGELIPLCHPIGLDEVNVDVIVVNDEVVITGRAVVHAKTGVEMEALTAVSVAALTIYDMCKALSHDIEIKSIRLMKKSGGKSEFNRES